MRHILKTCCRVEVRLNGGWGLSGFLSCSKQKLQRMIKGDSNMSIINSKQLNINDFSFLPYTKKYVTEKLWAAIRTTLSEVIGQNFSFLVPYGWKCHIGINAINEECDTASPIWKYEFSEGNKGSYASAKYSTLLVHRSWMSTGSWSDDDFLEMMNRLPESLKESKEFISNFSQIEKLESLSQMEQKQREWLRDECLLSTMRGAVRFPFSLTTENKAYQFELIISMDGATEKTHDEFLAIAIFKELRPTIARLFDCYAVEFEIYELVWDANIRFCMDMLKIQYESKPIE